MKTLGTWPWFFNLTVTTQGNNSCGSWWRFKFSDNIKRLVSGSSNSCNLGRKQPSSLHPKTQKPMNLSGFHYGDFYHSPSEPLP